MFVRTRITHLFAVMNEISVKLYHLADRLLIFLNVFELFVKRLWYWFSKL